VLSWSLTSLFVALLGEPGELGLYPQFIPLITCIRPCAVGIKQAGNKDETFVLFSQGKTVYSPRSAILLKT
jgi:F0F1-type ATP synthase epsilon subunit